MRLRVWHDTEGFEPDYPWSYAENACGDARWTMCWLKAWFNRGCPPAEAGGELLYAARRIYSRKYGKQNWSGG